MERATLVSALLIAAVPAGAAVNPPNVPPRLQASPAEEPAFMLSASGAHLYECRPNLNGGYGWVFTGPDATLTDGSVSRATLRGANNFESADDRSTATSVVRSAAFAGSDNLPWALLAARSSSDGGLFSGVTSVQRVNTAGGVAPRGGCGEYTAGSQARVDFTADYYFYRRRGTS
jgi:hypothetical protein